MPRQFYVYLHCDPSGTPFYVGKGYGRRSHDFYKRSQGHREVVSAHGKENIGIYVFPCESEDQAFADEKRHIKQLRRDGFDLVNLSNGGQGESGRTTSADTKAKISAALKGMKRSAETRAKIAVAMRGNKRGLGLKHSSEAIARSVAAHKGKTLPPEQRAQISARHKGTKHTAEHRAKISLGGKRRWERYRQQHSAITSTLK